MAARGIANAASKPIEGMYTASEAASIAGVSRQYLHKLRLSGKTPAYRLEKMNKSVRVYYPRDSFDRWLSQRNRK